MLGGRPSREEVVQLARRTGWARQGTGDMTVTDRETGGDTLSLAGVRAGLCSDSRMSHTVQWRN